MLWGWQGGGGGAGSLGSWWSWGDGAFLFEDKSVGTFSKDDFDTRSELGSFRMVDQFGVKKGAIGGLEVYDVAELVIVAPQGDGVLTRD